MNVIYRNELERLQYYNKNNQSNMFKVNFSTKTNYYLIKNNFKNLSDLLVVDTYDLVKIKGLTSSIKKEVLSFLSKIESDSCLEKVYMKKNNYYTLMKELSIYKTLSITKKHKIIIKYLEFFNIENYINDVEVDIFNQCFANKDYYEKLLLDEIVNFITNNQGVSISDLRSFNLYSDSNINTLIDLQRVVMIGDKFYVNYESYINIAKSFLSNKHLYILELRISGYSPEYIGSLLNVSKAKIRQELNKIKKQCKKNIFNFKESQYMTLLCSKDNDKYILNTLKFHYK